MIVKAIVRACGKGLVSAVVLSAACAAPPPASLFDAAALRGGLTGGEVAGEGFVHRTYAANGPSADRILYVYFGSDGSPFLDRRHVARDPTAREPLTLELLQRGPKPAVFLGRPCYHGLSAGCEPELWTIGRYSEPVVQSMATATRQLLEDGGFEAAVLVGYSGGGALALLVAERLDAVTAVITLAANLDIDAWTTLHGYTPLESSLNPVHAAGLRPDLAHLHLTGEHDRNVPPDVHARLEGKLPATALRVVSGFDHHCCWVESWPGLMTGLAIEAPLRPARGLP